MITGEGQMLKVGEGGLILGFEKLPREKKAEIEQIIEQKIKERQEQELKRLLKEVTEEIERTRQQLEEDD
ncbi:MAG: hypothetical protein KAJ23_03060 [Maribacter sp.]|nr:hypothetical protein [Maribacter sp.]